MTPRVAIITRTRDRLCLLRRAIQSILGQSFADWQHVIVNDGGDAAALDAALEPWREAYGDRLLVIHHPESRGMQPAANAGISATTSEFIGIHDDDDAWHPDYLADTVAFLDAEGPESRYQGVVTHVERVWEIVEGEEVRELSREAYLPLREINLFRVGYENPFPPIAFLYRRAAQERIGLYRPEFDVAADLDFNLRFLQRYEIGMLAQVRAYYHWRREGEGPLSNSVTTAQALHARKLNELKNHYLRTGANPAEAAIGLGLELAHYTLLQQWETRQILARVNQLPDHAHWQALTAEITRVTTASEHRILAEFYRKTVDVVHNVLREDHDGVIRARDAVLGALSARAEAIVYHLRVELEQREHQQAAQLANLREALLTTLAEAREDHRAGRRELLTHVLAQLAEFQAQAQTRKEALLARLDAGLTRLAENLTQQILGHIDARFNAQERLAHDRQQALLNRTEQLQNGLVRESTATRDALGTRLLEVVGAARDDLSTGITTALGATGRDVVAAVEAQGAHLQAAGRAQIDYLTAELRRVEAGRDEALQALLGRVDEVRANLSSTQADYQQSVLERLNAEAGERAQLAETLASRQAELAQAEDGRHITLVERLAHLEAQWALQMAQQAELIEALQGQLAAAKAEVTERLERKVIFKLGPLEICWPKPRRTQD